MKNKKIQSRRIGLFGGSFDPLHCAHLEIARLALQAAKLDQVLFIPAAQAPLKKSSPGAGTAARLEMLRLALQHDGNFALDTCEIERGGVNYTVDTINDFRQRYTTARLFWIIGSDQFVQLDKWYQIKELSQYVTFLVFSRPGNDPLSTVPITSLHYQLIDAPQMSESSTEIRERCRKGLPLEGLVPSKVEAFIFEQSLYTIDKKNNQ